jgi:hypothetical protein
MIMGVDLKALAIALLAGTASAIELDIKDQRESPILLGG